MPLASVFTVMDPSSSLAAKASRGASGTPSLSWRSSVSASSSSSHAVLVRSRTRRCSHSPALRPAPASGGAPRRLCDCEAAAKGPLELGRDL
eukprot:241753-Pleurochrysis_carterae.AAC.2